MNFEQAEKKYFELTKQHITKEEFLNKLLGLINKLDSLITIKNILVAKRNLQKMYDDISNDKRYLIKVEQAKITLDVLKEVVKLLLNDEDMKTFTSILFKIYKMRIDQNSIQHNYNRKNNWKK